ncbi:hypothetical protein ACLESD_40890, partial [Pyxidicoccus sp. 3LFB2]
MKLPFSSYADRWRPLSVLALGWGLVVPMPVLAAQQQDARPGVTRAPAALAPARVVEGDEASKARLIPGFEG